MEPQKIHSGNFVLNKFVFSFFTKGGYIVSEDFIVIGSCQHIVGTTTEKAHVPILCLV